MISTYCAAWVYDALKTHTILIRNSIYWRGINCDLNFNKQQRLNISETLRVWKFDRPTSKTDSVGFLIFTNFYFLCTSTSNSQFIVYRYILTYQKLITNISFSTRYSTYPHLLRINVSSPISWKSTSASLEHLRRTISYYSHEHHHPLLATS